MSLFQRIYFGIPKLYLETISATRLPFIAWISCFVIPAIAYLVMRVLTISANDPYLHMRVLVGGMASVTHSMNSVQPEDANALRIGATPLRANIAETLLVVGIRVQGEKDNQHVRQEDQRPSVPCGFGCGPTQ